MIKIDDAVAECLRANSDIRAAMLELDIATIHAAKGDIDLAATRVSDAAGMFRGIAVLLDDAAKCIVQGGGR